MLISLESLQIFLFFFISQLLSFSYLLVLGSQTILKKADKIVRRKTPEEYGFLFSVLKM